jgi:hypothetical protein
VSKKSMPLLFPAEDGLWSSPDAPLYCGNVDNILVESDFAHGLNHRFALAAN